MRIYYRNSILIFVIFLLQLSSFYCFSQEISFSANQEPLSEVLKMLSEKHDAKIAYDSDLASKIMVSGNYSGPTLFDVVNMLLKNTPLEALLINQVIVIRPKDKTDNPPIIAPEPPPPTIYRIVGVVRDVITHEHLPYASIAFEGSNRGTTSNSDGYFSIITENIDSLNLVVSYLGYAKRRVSIFPSEQSKQVVVDLNSQEVVIENTVIVKRQPDIVAAESTPSMLRWNSNRNTDMPSINGLDIAAPLQLLPGIDGTTESLSGLLIRKSSSDKNLFIFDGFTIYHIDHFFGAFTSFNSKSVKDIRVFKGGFDARWGSRASSVIEITGKTGNSNALSVDAGIDLLSADILVEGPMGKKATFLVAARRSFTDFFRSGVYYQLLESARSDIVLASKNFPAFLNTDADEPRFVYSDINAKLSFKPSEKDNISLTVFSGNDKLELDKETEYQTLSEDSDWGNGGVGARWARQWNDKFYHTLTLGTSRYHLDYIHSDSTIRKRQNSSIVDTIYRHISTANELNDVNVSWNNTLKIGAKNEFEFGLQANGVGVSLDEVVQHITNYVPIIDTTRSRVKSMLQPSLWAQHNFSSGRIKSLKIGSRLNYYPPTSKLYWEPRLQLSISLGEKSFLKFSTGKYYQFVNQIATYSAYNFRKAWVLSDNDRFPVVSSTHIIGGFLFKISKGITADIESYYKKTSGIIVMQTVLRRSGNGNGNRVQEEQVYYNISNTTKGVDFLLHKEFPSAQIWFAYTLSKSMNVSENINQGNPYPAYDDQLHELKLAGTAKWRGWGIAFATIYGSGKPWDEPLFTSTLQLSSDYKKNSNRLPMYFRIDVGVNYTHKFKSTELKAGINVFNILNRNNQLARVYQLSDTPLQTFLQTGTPLDYNNLMGMGIAQSVYFNVKF